MNEHENTLCHFGVKGMRWGVRRYRNRDGSLTPEGRRHKSSRYVTEKTEDHEVEQHKHPMSVGKKIAITGAVAAGAVLAVYGTQKVVEVTRNEGLGRAFVKQQANKTFKFTPKEKATMSRKFDESWTAIENNARNKWHAEHGHDYDEINDQVNAIMDRYEEKRRERERNRGL